MKTTMRLALTLTAFTAISAPLSAQSGGKAGRNNGVYDRNGDGVIDSRDQNGAGCRWYDVNCTIGNRTNGGTIDGSWQVIGRDNNGNTIYERRQVDRNGNVVVERARRDSYGRLVVIDRQVVNRNVRNNTVYGANGERCKYKENKNGYSTQCKYDRVKGNRGRDNRVRENDGDEDDRYENRGIVNNSSGPWYDSGAGNGKGKGKYKGNKSH